MTSIYLVPRIFLVVGVALLLAFGWFAADERRFSKSAVRTSGIVVRVDNGFPVIEFATAAGERVTFRSRTGGSPPPNQVGDTVAVLYLPHAPGEARNGGWFALHIGSFVTGLMAIIFGGVGGIWLIVESRARRIAADCRRYGQRVAAKIARIEHRTSITVRGRSPWRVVAEHEGREFYSRHFWENPTGRVGETVTLFIDRYHPKHYAMDVTTPQGELLTDTTR